MRKETGKKPRTHPPGESLGGRLVSEESKGMGQDESSNQRRKKLY